MEAESLNVVAVIAGTVAAFILGAVIYHPKVLGTVWANGAGVDLNEGPSPVVYVVQIIALVALAIVIGITATVNFLGTALLAIVAAAAFKVAGGMFQKNSTGALFTDGLHIVASGALMIVAQGIF